MVSLPQANAWIKRLNEDSLAKLNIELAKMEWLATMLGRDWKASNLTLCSPEEQKICRQKYGDDLEFVCRECKRK